MLNLYYKIWVDAITRLRSRPENEGMWKFYAVVFISMAQAINLLLIDVIAERYVFKTSAFDVKIHFFHNSKLDGFASFFSLFLLLPLAVNYLLIFRNKRYETLINQYRSYNGKLAAAYIVISYFLPFVLLLVGAALGLS
jgi:hypothetical protein